jgi:16S rRNA G966 N2-methylase RsmD
VAALRDNVGALGVGGIVRVRRADVLRELAALYREGERFDVVFLDPPYDTGLVETTLQVLGGGGLLLAEGLVIAQHFTKRAPAATLEALAAFRSRRFGETTLTFYRAARAGG